jgi:cupin fold WbuC family metalloprotein
MRVRKQNEEVLYADDMIVKVGRQDIELLKAKAEMNTRKRIRVCAHKTVEDSFHEMLIVHTRETYVRPHKHLNKPESFHLIEGSAQVVVFDDSGDILEVVQMGDYSSGKQFYYRMSQPLYHTVLITSDHLVFHEAANGPFVRSDTVFPSWAPDGSDLPAQRKFMTQLSQAVESFLLNRREDV